MMSSFGSRLLENSASVSTRFQSGLNPARRNSSRTSSASFGLSSTIRTRSGCETLSIQSGRLIEQQPVHSQVLHCGYKPLEVNWLYNVAVDPKLVGFHYVLLLLGRCQHHDW